MGEIESPILPQCSIRNPLEVLEPQSRNDRQAMVMGDPDQGLQDLATKSLPAGKIIRNPAIGFGGFIASHVEHNGGDATVR